MTFCNPKYLALFLLIVQNTFYIILLRYSRTRPGTMYLSSTAVCCDEVLKLVICLGILTFTYLLKKREVRSDGGAGGDGDEECRHLNLSETNGTSGDSDSNEAFDEEDSEDHGVEVSQLISPESFRLYMGRQLQFDIRMAGLAGLFVIQKNLIYLGISNLDAAVYQVTYQLKILTTAVFSVLLLKRKLNYNQIAGLLLLTLGVAIVQFDDVNENASKSYQEQRAWVGLLAVFGACCTSGFGGVYFELVLKPKEAINEMSAPPPSVWAKNVQLSTFALVIALTTAFLRDGRAILADGFFQGYSPVVLGVIALQAGGGLVVAAVVKYADNILKSFAAAMSIVSSTLISAWAFGFSVSALFAFGCLLQFAAIGLYSRKVESNDESTRSVKLSEQTSSIATMCPKTNSYSDSGDVEMQTKGGSITYRAQRKNEL